MGDTRSSGEQTQNASGENLGPAGGSCQTAGACVGFASEQGTRVPLSGFKGVSSPGESWRGPLTRVRLGRRACSLFALGFTLRLHISLSAASAFLRKVGRT